jgi:hypothetical protein
VWVSACDDWAAGAHTHGNPADRWHGSASKSSALSSSPSLAVSGTDWEGDAENEHAAIAEAYKQWDEERGGGRRPGGTIVHVTQLDP